MQIVCVKEGRMGFSIGDTVEVPDGCIYDTEHFATVGEGDGSDPEKLRAEKLAADQAALDAATAQLEKDSE